MNGQFTKGLLEADLDQDGKIDGLDLAVLLGEWGASGGIADINEDGIVDGGDLAKLLGQWAGQPRPIVGESSGGARLVDPSFEGGLYTSVTYDTSWMDIPIITLVNDIQYSNVTN